MPKDNPFIGERIDFNLEITILLSGHTLTCIDDLVSLQLLLKLFKVFSNYTVVRLLFFSLGIFAIVQEDVQVFITISILKLINVFTA